MAIRINEVDSSWYARRQQPAPITIYTPGITSFGPETPTLVTSETFSTVFGGNVPGVDTVNLDIVKTFLLEGATVLFHRMVPEGAEKADTVCATLSDRVTVGNVYKVLADEEHTFVASVEAGSPLQWKEGDTVVDLAATYGISFETGTEILNGDTLTVKFFAQTCKVDDAPENAEVSFSPVADVSDGSFTLTYQDDKWYSGSDEFDLAAHGLTVSAVSGTTFEDGDTLSFKLQTEAPDAATETPSVTVTAKYPGSFGNKIAVEFVGMTYNEATQSISGTAIVHFDTLTVEYVTINDLISGDYTSTYVDFATTYQRSQSGVAVQRLNSTSEKFLSGGRDCGEDVTDIVDSAVGKFVSDNKPGDLADVLLYDFDVATTIGYDAKKMYTISEDPKIETSLDARMANMVTSRGDAMYFIDGTEDMTPTDLFVYWGQFSNSQCAGFGPWCRCQILSTGITRKVPASYPVLVAWINSVQEGNPVWKAPAGVNRASLSTVVDLLYPTGRHTIDVWVDNDSIAGSTYQANPIVNLRQYGYVVCNDATLLKRSASGKTSMLQQIGVRMMANAIKKRALIISLGLQFDQLTTSLLLSYKTLLTTYLSTLAYQEGLYGYEVIVGQQSTLTSTELNTRTIPVIIRISPNPSVKGFDITLEVSQAGVTYGTEG